MWEEETLETELGVARGVFPNLGDEQRRTSPYRIFMDPITVWVTLG